MNETFEPVLLRRVGKPNPQLLSGYIADGGYQGLRKRWRWSRSR